MKVYRYLFFRVYSFSKRMKNSNPIMGAFFFFTAWAMFYIEFFLSTSATFMGWDDRALFPEKEKFLFVLFGWLIINYLYLVAGGRLKAIEREFANVAATTRKNVLLGLFVFGLPVIMFSVMLYTLWPPQWR